MSDLTKATTTMSNIGVAMFTVADQDAAIAFYTEKLGFELRSDTAFGENGIDPEPMSGPGMPTLFMLRDPDGNHVAVVEAPPAA